MAKPSFDPKNSSNEEVEQMGELNGCFEVAFLLSIQRNWRLLVSFVQDHLPLPATELA